MRLLIRYFSWIHENGQLSHRDDRSDYLLLPCWSPRANQPGLNRRSKPRKELRPNSAPNSCRSVLRRRSPTTWTPSWCPKKSRESLGLFAAATARVGSILDPVDLAVGQAEVVSLKQRASDRYPDSFVSISGTHNSTSTYTRFTMIWTIQIRQDSENSMTKREFSL